MKMIKLTSSLGCPVYINVATPPVIESRKGVEPGRNQGFHTVLYVEGQQIWIKESTEDIISLLEKWGNLEIIKVPHKPNEAKG